MQKSKLIIVIVLVLLLLGVVGYLSYSMIVGSTNECETLQLPEGTCSQATIDSVKQECINFGIPLSECTHPNVLYEINRQAPPVQSNTTVDATVEPNNEITPEEDPEELEETESELEDTEGDLEAIAKPAINNKKVLPKVKLIKQLSGKKCIKNKTYKPIKNGLWVNKGCRGLFSVNGTEIKCESENNKKKKCKLDPMEEAIMLSETDKALCQVYKIPEDKCLKSNIDDIINNCNKYKIPTEECIYPFALGFKDKCISVDLKGKKCNYINYKAKQLNN